LGFGPKGFNPPWVYPLDFHRGGFRNLPHFHLGCTFLPKKEREHQLGVGGKKQRFVPVTWEFLPPEEQLRVSENPEGPTHWFPETLPVYSKVTGTVRVTSGVFLGNLSFGLGVLPVWRTLKPKFG